MHDAPDPLALLQAVAGFLRAEAIPALSGATAYQARVAANMLDIAARELALAPAAQAEELASLRALLGRVDGGGSPADELAALNRALCEAIAAGRAGPDTPGLADHLWRTTLAKLAVDQPRYDTYRRVVGPPPAGD